MLSSLLFWRQRRYIICFLALMGFSLQYMMRVNLSVAIFAMTDKTQKGYVNWSPRDQNSLLGIFYYGYIMTQFSGGYIADRIGGKKVLLCSVFTSSILSFITPLCARWDIISLFIVRVLLGASQGVIYPCVYPTLRKWVPPWERSQLCLIVFTGNYLGTTIGVFLSGIICESLSWSWVFYLYGVCGIIWCIPWYFCVSESPVNDKRISRQELLILQEALNTLTRDYNSKIPWKKILTSIPVWAIAAADFGNSFGYYLVLTQFPIYLNDVHYSDDRKKVQNYGTLSSIPHMIMIFTSLVSGFIADICIKKNLMTVSVCRKVFTCGPFLVQAITSVAAACAGNTTVGIALIILNVSVGAIGWAGYSVNYLDICPQYAGISMGLANTFGTIPGILMTILINHFVHNENINMQIYIKWRLIFLITTAFCILGFIVYALCASGEREPWSMNIYRNTSDNETLERVVSKNDSDMKEPVENVVLMLGRKKENNKDEINDDTENEKEDSAVTFEKNNEVVTDKYSSEKVSKKDEKDEVKEDEMAEKDNETVSDKHNIIKKDSKEEKMDEERKKMYNLLFP